MLDDCHACKAALTTGVSHSEYWDGFLSNIWWSGTEAFIILWAQCGGWQIQQSFNWL